MKNVFFYQMDIGRIGMAENGTAITNVYFNGGSPGDALLQETDLLKEAGRQLKDYLTGKRKTFELPLAPDGTEFQQKVWQSLQEIPYGETRSYGEVAKSIGNPQSSRAVGMANHKNPIPIFIPCHRVIGAKGDLVGYAGGLSVKISLLKLEKQHANDYAQTICRTGNSKKLPPS
ncbi:MAG: methylated-DNA--[protein]-cysteine S-methyltransferase [Veillonellales bacterium]